MWQTPLARELLMRYYGTDAPTTPIPVLAWLRRHVQAQRAVLNEPPRLSIEQGLATPHLPAAPADWRQRGRW
jgi:hypothetical protein